MATRTDERSLREAAEALAQLGLAAAAGWRPLERAALVRLGQARLARGDWAAACGLLEYAVLLEPAAARTWELVAGARMASRRWVEALAALEIAWSLEPSWRGAAAAALCCDRLGEVEGSARWREAARALPSADPEERRQLERALAPVEEAAS